VRLLAGRPTVADPEALLDELRAIADEHGAGVQAFDASYVAGRGHLERAVELARRERERGDGIADSLSVEVLCYAAGRRQISDALTMGVDEATEGVVVVVLERSDGDDDARADPTDAVDRACDRLQEDFDLADSTTDAEARTVLESIDEARLCSYFDVSAAERDAALADLPELVAERVALLVVER
jgi:KEOPS complex subunit Cgi121